MYPQSYQGCCSRRTPSSFDCGDPGPTHRFFLEHGYHEVPIRSFAEYARLRNDTHGCLVVLYKTGTVLLQGANTRPAVALIEQRRMTVQEGCK